MKMIKQLLRQPIKLIAGILVISLAASILSVCLGQAIVAANTEETLEYIFTTVALPTTKYNYTENATITGFDGTVFTYRRFSPTLPEKVAAFMDKLVAEHSELIKSVANPGLASAYLPELTLDNVTQHNRMIPKKNRYASAHVFEAPTTYACTMLEIVLEEIGEPRWSSRKEVKEDGTEVNFISTVFLDLSGTIQSVVSLEDGYADPTGRTIHISMELPSLESLEALGLEEGGRYLVAGYDYWDTDWLLQNIIAEQISEHSTYAVDYREIDTDLLEYLTEEEKAYYLKGHPEETEAPEACYTYDGARNYFKKTYTDLKNTVELTIRDDSAFGEIKTVTHDKGSYSIIDYTRYLTDENGNQVQITEEEWQARYQIPTIAPLEGSVEEFLAANPHWQEQLEHMEVNYHAFPIVGVEKLVYIADFAMRKANIVEGRDFTDEELEAGAKVCILSQSLAEANGLKVGDTISPQFYNYDHDNPNQDFLSEASGLVNPSAYKYTNTTQWAGTEAYTIVGLYRQDNPWSDVSENIYSFTPNTIFVPHSSVTSDMDYGDQAFFRTLVLQNGTAAQLLAQVEEAGYEGLFLFYDNEYTVVADTLMNYREVAQRAMVIGTVVYAIILLLFLLLFPGSQGRSLRTLNALGAKRGHRIAHVFNSAAGILVPGSILGCLAGMLLWGRVVGWLAESAGETVTLEMEPRMLVGITLAQLGLALVLTLLLALPMSRNKGIRKRKG